MPLGASRSRSIRSKRAVQVNASAEQRAESRYRRGAVLGLTIAEIFILLLFLLVLAFLVLWQNLEAEQKEQQQFRERWEAPLAEIETPEELRRLRVFNETWQESLQGFEAPNEITTLKALKEEVEQSHGDLYRQLVEAQSAGSDAAEENRRLEETLVEERREREQAEQQASQLSNELRVLKKGQNPPCWYELVPDDEGGEREKPLYAFDIGVFDEHMVIRRREPPPGGASDDGGAAYAEEWSDLRMGEVTYDVPLSNQELVSQLQRIHDAGRRREVRSYSCVFSVRVWDETSSGAKQRWQQAHDRTLEWLFGTYRVQDESWGSIG